MGAHFSKAFFFLFPYRLGAWNRLTSERHSNRKLFCLALIGINYYPPDRTNFRLLCCSLVLIVHLFSFLCVFVVVAVVVFWITYLMMLQFILHLLLDCRMAIPVGKWVEFLRFIYFIFFRVGKSLACHSPAKWCLCA